MKLAFPFPLTPVPDTQSTIAVNRTLVAGASATVIGSVAIPQGVSIVHALIGASGGTAGAGYQLRGVVKRFDSLAAVAAQTLTVASANFSAAETVTIGTTVYTFRASVTTTAYEVKVGTNATESLANLKNAINGGTGAGTTYGSLTVAHPDVVAISSDATTLVINAKVAGTGGNSIATTETCSTVSWGASTMAAGANAGVLVSTVDALDKEDDSAWACTLTVGGTGLTLELKGTPDSADDTTFSGFITLYNMV